MPLTVTGNSGTQYTFEGPFDNTNNLSDNSGIYIIICSNGETNTPIDVGESSTVKTRIKNHDRADCWKRNCKNTLMVAVLYTPNKQQAGRMVIEQDIRSNYIFPCGIK